MKIVQLRFEKMLPFLFYIYYGIEEQNVDVIVSNDIGLGKNQNLISRRST